MSESELYVVCRNCSAEVSPYVTECPYCGQRVRKRAPKITRDGVAEPRKPRLRRRPSLGRLRPGEIPGIAPETRPYATLVLVALSLAATLALATGEVFPFDLGAIEGPIGDEWWRVATTPFIHDNAGYQFVALIATVIFGMHLERRFGPAATPIVFVASGAAGAALSVVAELYPTMGANGAALGLLTAWLAEDRLALRAGDDRENDLLGVYAIAAVLVLLSAATEQASLVAAAGGALMGTLAGFALRKLARSR